MRRSRSTLPFPALLVLLLAGIALQSAGCSSRKSAVAKINSEFQAVLLTNGQVFFGKLEGLGTAYPVLREVYYIRTVPGSTDDTKATNVLVRRGQEWHAPDFMVINADHIMLVEPVTKDSRVAHLIAEQQQK